MSINVSEELAKRGIPTIDEKVVRFSESESLHIGAYGPVSEEQLEGLLGPDSPLSKAAAEYFDRVYEDNTRHLTPEEKAHVDAWWHSKPGREKDLYNVCRPAHDAIHTIISMGCG